MWLSKTYVCLEGYIFCIREKDWYIDNKSEGEESALLAVFAQNLSALLFLIMRVLGKKCKGGGEGSLSKWNQGEIIEISHYVVHAVLGKFS